ncbi:MAG: ABC transporter substrate-binding protein [Acidimicrobiia bacterium]
MRKTAGMLLAAVVATSGFVATTAIGAAPSGAATTKCPLSALKSATKPVEITMWHSMPRENETTLQALTDTFNSSQSAVKVKLVNQVTYDDTFTKYKAGLASGDLPDIVQLQETEQQQMIDTQSIVPSGACAKADKYTFGDYLPRVVSYFTVNGQMYAMPFNTSGPVLYYNKKAFTAAGLDPNKPPTTLAEVRTAAEALKAKGAVTGAPFGLKVEPGFVEHWLGLSSELYVNNKNGRSGRATKSVLNGSTGKQIFSWLGGMVKDGLAQTNPKDGPSQFDDLIGIGTGSHAMAIDTSASLGTISSVLASGAYPNVELGVAPMPGLVTGKGGVLVSGGALYISNKSTPAKQAAAWQFEKFLDSAASQITWATGTGYLPIVKKAADSPEVAAFWAKNPGYKVAYEQLLNGPVNTATSGSVIGDYVGVRKAVEDGENSMFLNGTAPDAAVKTTASNATTAMDDYNVRVVGN